MSQTPISWGGVVGGYMSSLLERTLNFYGSLLILLTTLMVGFFSLTEMEFDKIKKYAPPLFLAPSKFFQLIFKKTFFRKFKTTRAEGSQTDSSLFQEKEEKNSHLPVLSFFKKNSKDSQFNCVRETPMGPKNSSTTQILNTKKSSRGDSGIQKKDQDWQLPSLQMLQDPPRLRHQVKQTEINQKSQILINKLAQFSIRGEIVNAKPGPAVTLFEFKPAEDVKISKITDLADDLSLALSCESLRIIAPIPGRNVVGIETSNSKPEIVYLKDILFQDDFWKSDMTLPLALGRQADGHPKVVDLRKMPHLLVAGTTGSGKSVFVVSALTGLLFKHSPDTLKLLLIDPKQVDFALFTQIPHLIMPTICEPKKAVYSLKWALKEMEKRYRSMSRFSARGLEAYNEKTNQLTSEQKKQHQTFNEELEKQKRGNETYYFTPQPYIIIAVEEFGDLMAVDKSNVEQLVVRLAQMARASGMHLILAMQSPRKDVVTGLIKTNIPGRISFKVSSKMDSRIILDEGGAERLLTRGDLLFLAPGVSKPHRHHGPWLGEDEIQSIIEHWSDQGDPQYNTLEPDFPQTKAPEFALESLDHNEEWDDKYDEILTWVCSLKEVSASLIQRKFRIGYPRAARMIETMEQESIVGPPNGSKPRIVIHRPNP